MAYQKFSFANLVVVGFILIVAVVLVLPMIGTHPGRGWKVRAQSQLASINAACEAYALTMGNAPGYFDDNELNRDVFTGTENMMLSLLGGIVPANGNSLTKDATLPSPPDGWKFDLDDLGGGPRSIKGNRYGAFYSPKPAELAVVTGTLGSDNAMPEFVEYRSGSPILYYRFDLDRQLDTSANGDYLNARNLSGHMGPIDTANSLLRDDRPGGRAAANALLKAIATDPKSKSTDDKWLLISPGPNGVWFGAEDHADFDPFDRDTREDVWRIGG